MKHLILILACALLASQGFGQLVEVNSTPGASAMEYSFVSDDIGYARMYQNDFSKYYFINKTVNAGDSWTEIPSPNGSSWIASIHFPSDQVGYVMTHPESSVLTDSVYKTTNDGEQWINVTPSIAPMDVSIKLHFLNNDVGFILTRYPYFFKTINGGATWDTVHITSSQPFGIRPQSFHALDEDHIAVGFHDNSFLYKGGVMITSTGGQSWKEVVFPRIQGVIGRVQFTSTTTVYAAAQGWGSNDLPFLYKTETAGASWDSLNLPVMTTLEEDTRFTAFHFIDDERGYIIMDNLETDTRHFYSTTNGGVGWLLFDSTSVPELREFVLTENRGFATGSENAFVRFDMTTGIEEETTIQFDVFPNPAVAGEVLQLQFATSGNRLIKVLNLQGQVVFLQQVLAAQSQLGIPAEIPGGLYLISVESSREHRTMPLIIR